MKHLRSIVLLIALVLTLGAAALAQDTVELNFMCYNNGIECEVYADLLSRFTADNSDIVVNVDTVPYTTVRDQLRVQVEAGQAPDMARITDFGGMAGFYLDLRPLLSDASIIEDSFSAPYLQAFRAGDDDDGLYAFPDELSVTAAFINRTLFDQAGVDVPSDMSDEVDWATWTAAITEVAEATGTPYAFAIDNKGHRFASAGFALGIELFDEDGNFALEDDAGYRAFAEWMKAWFDNGLTPAEVWLGGGQYSSARDYFVNAEVVMLYSGSWQINGFGSEIGDAFDWVLAPNPVGPGGSAGASGGASIVGYAQTEHPEAVARVMEYLLQPEVGQEFASRTLLIPPNPPVVALGVEFDTDNAAISAALNQAGIDGTKVTENGVAMNLHPLAFAYYDASNTRLAQYFAGELTLDEAMTRLQEQLDEAAANLAAG